MRFIFHHGLHNLLLREGQRSALTSNYANSVSLIEATTTVTKSCANVSA